MDKIQGYLQAGSGRSIGKLPGEFVFLYPASGLLHVDEVGVKPYITTLQAMGNYQFHPFTEKEQAEFDSMKDAKDAVKAEVVAEAKITKAKVPRKK